MDLVEYLKMKTIELPYDGYWKKESLPTYSGLYYVFATKFTQEGKLTGKRLIYIGEADSIHKRHNGTKEEPQEHEHLQDFIDELQDGEELCYATSKYDGSGKDRKMIESAMIYAIKPAVNIKNTVTYNDEPVRIDLKGTDRAFPPYKKIQLTKDSDGEWKVLKQKS